MHRRKYLKTVTSVMLAGALLLSLTACESGKKNDRERDEEETEQTAEQKTPETSAETTVAEISAVPETEAAPDTSAEYDRFREFFENEYPNLSNSMMFDINCIEVLYAYADLDLDGINELLIGDAEGVYAVVSEGDGLYHVTEFNGWRTQYGAVPCEYVGNGCFLTSIYNGNNYGGEFCVDVLWRYDSSTAVGRVVLARLSGSWDPSNLSENLSKWELYIAADENGTLSENDEGFTPDFPNYNYSMIDFGDNYQFENGERVYNEIEQQFYSYVDSHRAEGAMAEFQWMPVSGFN